MILLIGLVVVSVDPYGIFDSNLIMVGIGKLKIPKLDKNEKIEEKDNELIKKETIKNNKRNIKSPISEESIDINLDEFNSPN